MQPLLPVALFFSPPKPVLFSVLLLFCRPEGELSMTSGVQYPLLPPGRLTAQCEQKKQTKKTPNERILPVGLFVCLSVTTCTACFQSGGSDGGQEVKEPL